jgi:hypothetical protein
MFLVSVLVFRPYQQNEGKIHEFQWGALLLGYSDECQLFDNCRMLQGLYGLQVLNSGHSWTAETWNHWHQLSFEYTRTE